MTEDKIQILQEKFKSAKTKEVLEYFLNKYQDKIVLASSLGLEDQVLTHMATSINPKTRIFVLDTGRLHNETYEVLALSAKKYAINYEILYPNTNNVEKMVQKKGINLFYESIENRKECCFVRKVEPLNRILKTTEAWITGLRASQAHSRQDMHVVEWDSNHSIIKLNPLLHWSFEDVKKYIAEHNIPYNKLHDQGYPSIGCAPCTRAIEPGEDIRAGRWWWETPEGKECGLHVVDGKLVPKRNK